MKDMSTLSQDWYVYIVRCSDRSFYTGVSNDVERRVRMHSIGQGAKYTQPAARRPVTLVYRRLCPSKSAALKEEHRIKKLTKRQKVALIYGV